MSLPDNHPKYKFVWVQLNPQRFLTVSSNLDEAHRTKLIQFIHDEYDPFDHDGRFVTVNGTSDLDPFFDEARAWYTKFIPSSKILNPNEYIDHDGNKVLDESTISWIQTRSKEHYISEDYQWAHPNQEIDSSTQNISVARYADENITKDIKVSYAPQCHVDLISRVFGRMSEARPLNSGSYDEDRHDLEVFVLGMTPSTTAGTLPPKLFVDSGASNHAVGDDRILSNLRALPAGRAVTLADGSRLAVTKVGDIETEEIKLQDVFFVPGLQMNLVSVRQLAKSKIVTTFFENYAELCLSGIRVGGALVDDSVSLYQLFYLQEA